jgi:dienelactone hydrolase
MQADFGRQLYSVSSDTLVRLASGLSEQCVKKQCGLAGLCFGGRTALDLHLSRVHMVVAGMGQDRNYQLDITKLNWGEKRGKKHPPIKKIIIVQ